MHRILLVFLCLLLLTGAVFAADAVVDTMDTQCTLAEDGAATVAINARFTFHRTVSAFTFALPPDAGNITVTGCRVSTAKKDGYLLLTAYNEAGFSGSQDFVITYTQQASVSEDEDGQNLSVALLAPGWEYAITALTLHVTLPKAFDAVPVFVSGYYNELIDNFMDISVEENVLTAVLTQALMDHEALTLSMELPAQYFDLRFQPGRSASLDVVAFFLLMALALAYWFFFLRGKLFFPKSQAMPPVGGNVGSIPYQLCRRPARFGDMVLHWASMGYISIARTKNGRIFLRKLISMGNERKSYEINAFRTLFRNTDLCSATSGDFAAARQLAIDGVAGYWSGKLFRARGGSVLLLRLLALAAGCFCCVLCFDNLLAPTSSRWVWILLLTAFGTLALWLVQQLADALFEPHPGRTVAYGAVAAVALLVCGLVAGTGALTILCLLLQLLVSFAVLFGSRRTKAGFTLLTELLGLRRFMRSAPPQTLLQLQAQDPQYFTRTFPYAQALCVGPSFCGSFGKQRLEECTWLTADGSSAKTASGFARLYCEVADALNGNDTPGLPERLLRRLNERRKPPARTS